MRYIVDGVVKKSGIIGALINLDQLKVFHNVDHQFLAAVLTAAYFGQVLRA